jgi:hypothetical protein
VGRLIPEGQHRLERIGESVRPPAAVGEEPDPDFGAGTGLGAEPGGDLPAEDRLAYPVGSEELGVVAVQGGAEPPVESLPDARPGREEQEESDEEQASRGANGNLG